MTSLSLYEDLLAPGESIRLPAGGRMVYVASGELATLHAGTAAFGDEEAELAAGIDGATRAPLGADRVVGGRREALGPRRARPLGGLRDAVRARRRPRRGPGDRLRPPRRALGRRRERAAVRRLRRAGRGLGPGLVRPRRPRPRGGLERRRRAGAGRDRTSDARSGGKVLVDQLALHGASWRSASRRELPRRARRAPRRADPARHLPPRGRGGEHGRGVRASSPAGRASASSRAARVPRTRRSASTPPTRTRRRSSSCRPGRPRHAEREAFQEIDYRRMFSSIAKWVAQIESAGGSPELVAPRVHGRDRWEARGRSCSRSRRTCSWTRST